MIHLTLKSRNSKTGPMPVSTTKSSSCPPSCALLQSGACYAKHGPLGMFWRKIDNGAGGSWRSFIDAITALPDSTIWRHNQAGDLPGIGNRIAAGMLAKLVAANRNKRGFTYTHKPMTIAVNRRAVQHANKNGFTINLSGNNPADADRLADLNIGPVVTVMPSDFKGTTTTPQGRVIVQCPATARDDINCKSCGLCQRQRNTIVGFPAHGISKRKASAMAASL